MLFHLTYIFGCEKASWALSLILPMQSMLQFGEDAPDHPLIYLPQITLSARLHEQGHPDFSG